jgi:signal transduction histidine kinase
VFVELLTEMDRATPSSELYNRLCEAVCRLTSMHRAALFLYDDVLHRVRPAGTHGLDPAVLDDVHEALEETPLAQRALATDRVVEASERIEREVPGRYARLLGITTLTCTPVSAGGRWLGVLFADRGGGMFTLTEGERHAMWMLGKVTALAASAGLATRRQEEARRLAERIDLAREIHERVIQRLFGVSLALGSERELTREERRRCRSEMEAALSDLRIALRRPLAPRTRPTQSTLREELRRLRHRYSRLPIEVRWEGGHSVPSQLEPLAQSVLAEALRNVDKHASPTRVEVRVGASEGNLVLEVLNDGVGDDSRGDGMGLRLAALEAIRLGGVLEFGPAGEGEWHVRLVAPERPE